MNASTELATRPAEGLLAVSPDQTGWSEVQLAALRQLGVSEASTGDLNVFLNYTQRTGLDPFTQQICMVGRWDSQLGAKKQTIQVQIAGLRTLAQRTGQYAGRLGPFWCGEDGVWKDVWLDDVPPKAARVGTLRHGFKEPLWNVCLWREFVATTREGHPTAMWRNKGVLMLGKCAEAGALRAAFPIDLSGLYIAEEMQSGDVTAGVPEVVAVTGETPATPVDAAANAAPVAQAEAQPQPPADASALLQMLGDTKDVELVRKMFRYASAQGWLNLVFADKPLRAWLVEAQALITKGKAFVPPTLPDPADEYADAELVEDNFTGSPA